MWVSFAEFVRYFWGHQGFQVLLAIPDREISVGLVSNESVQLIALR